MRFLPFTWANLQVRSPLIGLQVNTFCLVLDAVLMFPDASERTAFSQHQRFSFSVYKICKYHFLFLSSLNGSVVLALHLCVNLLFSFAFSCFSVFPAGFVVCISRFIFCSASSVAPVMLFSSSPIFADGFLLRVLSLIAFFLLFFSATCLKLLRHEPLLPPVVEQGYCQRCAVKRSRWRKWVMIKIISLHLWGFWGDLTTDFWMNNQMLQKNKHVK